MSNGNKHIRYRPVKKRKRPPTGDLRYGPLFTGCPAVELAVERLYQAGDKDREDRFWGLIKALNYALQMETRVLAPVQLTPEGSQGQFSWASSPIPAEKAADLSLWTLATPKGYRVLPVFTRTEEADGSPATLGLPMAELPLEQVMRQALDRTDLTALVINPWGRSATLDKGLLRGLLYSHGPDPAPGEEEAKKGVQAASLGLWENAAGWFAASADKGCPEGMKAAAAGDIPAAVAIGDRYAAGTARTPGDPGRALMAYRRAAALAETEMDITTWPLICLRQAQYEARGIDLERAARLLAEAVQGLRLLWQETGDPDARHEMLRAAADLADCALAAYDGAETVRESLRKLSAQLNTESLHFS